jgi:sporulation protein YlmC with PRC-barrel domain
MLKQLATATALTALALVPAIGQDKVTQPTAGGSPSANSFLQQQSPNEWRAYKLIGASVTGPDNQSIGKISDLLVDQNGTVEAAVVGVGGFLGIGEKDVAIPFKNLKVTRKSNSNTIDNVAVSYTKDQLNSAPSFKFLASQ